MYTLLPILLGLLLFAPSHNAQAVVAEAAGWGLAKLAGVAAGWTWEGITMIVTSMVYTIATMVGYLISWLARVLNYLIYFPVYPTNGADISVIRESWTIFRDIVNMFFIIVLVVAAFATIFDIFPKFGQYNIKNIIKRFLISAILINFSFIIGVLLIDFSQVISNIFLKAIGDISIRLGQAFNPFQFFPSGPPTGVATEQLFANSLVGLVATIFFLFVYAGAIFTAVVFTLLRIPILWGLLIVSPVAWMAYILPFSNKWFTKWWDWYRRWKLY